MPNKLLFCFFLYLSLQIINADENKNHLFISIIGNDSILIEPGGSLSPEKPTVFYETDKESTIDVLITNLSDKIMVLIGRPFSSLIITIENSKGIKYMWPIESRLNIGGPIHVIYLDRYASILYAIPINKIKNYTPPAVGKKENIKVTAKFITQESIYEKIPVELLNNKEIFKGELVSQEKELTIYNISGLLGANKTVMKKRQMAIEKGKMINSINHDIVIDRLNVDNLTLNDTLNFLDEYIKTMYEGKKIKVNIVNTLVDKEKDIPHISFSVENVTIEKVVSIICKEAGLKYVIGKDAIYIGY